MDCRLAIAWPLTDEHIWTKFLLSWTLMEKPEFYTLLTPQFYGHIDEVRSGLAMQAIGEKVDYMLMMDTDQTFPEDTIPKMLQWMDDGYTMVGAVVHRRYPPFDAILYRGRLTQYHHVPDDEIYSGELIEVDATGGGCFIVNVNKVVDAIGVSGWFKLVQGPTGKPVGEDIYFCNKLRDAGVKIYIDTSIQCGHKATMEVNSGTYYLYKKLKGYEWNKDTDDPNYVEDLAKSKGEIQLNLFDQQSLAV